MLVIAFTNSCSFLFLYVVIPLVPLLFLVSALPHGRRHSQTTLVVHSLWNPRAGRQEYKRKHEHISFSQVLRFLSCFSKDNRRRKGIYFPEIIIRTGQQAGRRRLVGTTHVTRSVGKPAAWWQDLEWQWDPGESFSSFSLSTTAYCSSNRNWVYILLWSKRFFSVNFCNHPKKVVMKTCQRNWVHV